MVKRSLVLFLFILLIVQPYMIFASPVDSKHLADLNMVKDRQVMLRVQDGEHFDPTELGLTAVNTPNILKENSYHLVRIPESLNFGTMLDTIRQHPAVAMAEPNLIQQGSVLHANENLMPMEWYLEHINLPRNWDYQGPITPVTVALLDTGVRTDHPALKGRLLNGYNVVAENNDYDDDNGHGTFIAGVIASVTNPDYLGVDLQTRILPVKIMDDEGESSIASTVAGVYYAIKRGADIINMSFVSYYDNEIQRTALKEAREQGITLIAAAGNEAVDKYAYPASYGPVLSVTSVGVKDEHSSFSNYGDFVDITAPGEHILSLSLDEKHLAIGSGTSFSVPIVSGVVALLKSVHPEWTEQELEWALEHSARPVDEREWNPYTGYGVLDVKSALAVNVPTWKNDAANVLSNARDITSGRYTREKVDYPGDMDWFHFRVDEAGDMKISLQHFAPFIDLAAILVKPDGSKIEINRSGKGVAEEYRFFAEKGDYYLQVSEKFHHWSKDDYRLAVARDGQEILEDSGFSDVTRYQEEINYLTEHGIIQGYPDNTFKPQRAVTRLQAVQMILNEMNVAYETASVVNPGFSDVSPNTYGYKAIAKAVELGIIQGKENGTFDPSGTLTRGQMAAMLVNAYNLSGMRANDFSDVPKGHWAYEAVGKLAGSGVTKGYPDNTFRPNDRVSREHFALFMYNYLNGE